MKAKSVTATDSTKAKFIGLFVTSVVLCVVVTSAFWGQRPVSSYPSDTYSGKSTEPDKSGVTVLPDSASIIGQRNAGVMTDAEKSLSLSMDSLHTTDSPEKTARINSTLALFREAIKNPNAVSLLNDALKNKTRPGTATQEELTKLKDDNLVKDGQIASLTNQLKNSQKDAGATQPEIRKLQEEIQDKKTRIATLQSQLKARPQDKAAATDPQAVAKLKDELQSKEAQIAKLMTQLKTRPNAGNAGSLLEENKKLADENNFLKWAVRSEVSSNHNLTNLNNSLKQANATLQNQVTELKKNQ